MAYAIESERLSKFFGKQHAVHEIDLRVPERSIYAFLGQNGAGKTTTIRLILGLIRPTGGTVSVWGRDASKDRLVALQQIGSLVETPPLYDRLTGRENLELTRQMLGVSASETDRVLEVVDLKSAAGRLVGGYSLGMRQRLGLARAMLGQPRLLILDEPVNGLDPEGILEMRELIRSLPSTGEVTVFISSHLLDEVEQIATHVGLMHAGRLLEQRPLKDLIASEPQTVKVDVSEADRAAALLAQAGFQASASGATSVTVGVPRELSSEQVAEQANRALINGNLSVFGLLRSSSSLEQIYLRAINSAGNANR